MIKQLLVPEVVRVTNHGCEVVSDAKKLLLDQLRKTIFHHVVPEVEKIVRGRLRVFPAYHSSFNHTDKRFGHCSLCDLGV